MAGSQEPDLQDLDKAILKALSISGGAGTARNVEVMLEYSGQVERFEEGEDLDVPDRQISQETIQKRLSVLAKHGLIDYQGHGEYTINDQGRDYLEGEISAHELSTETQSRLEKLNAKSTDLVFHAISIIGVGVLLYLLITGYVCPAGDEAPYLIGILAIPFLLLVSSLHILNLAKPLSTRITTRLTIGSPVSGHNMSQEEEAAREEGKLDEAASAFSNAFRLRAFEWLIFLLGIGILIDLSLGVSNQMYGLLFDVVGGLLLALQAFRATGGLQSSGMDLGTTDYRSQALEVNEGVWGTLFLLAGFSMQLLALLPWNWLPIIWIC